MVNDYIFPEKRKSKCDKKAKARYIKYKKGGKFRSANINAFSNKTDN
ncbi:MAG: hypothetical protein N3D20_01400 [Candidatus Pacearchaeota archaeon]|nr:hypothetical protein [Candidatus Pacearchaeota archaeon]